MNTSPAPGAIPPSRSPWSRTPSPTPIPADGIQFQFTGDLFALLEDDGDELDAQPSRETFPDLAPGQFDVTESFIADWTLASISCDDAGTIVTESTRSAAIDLDPGEHLTCTWRNTTQSITLVKDAQPDTDPADGIQFQFTGDLFALLEDDGDELDAQPSRETFPDLAPGQFDVTESSSSDWTLASISCDDAGTIVTESTRSAAIDLDPGEHLTCTWRNTTQSITLVKDAQPDTDPADGIQFQFTGDLFALLEDDGDELDAQPSRETFPDLAPGQFDVTESFIVGLDAGLDQLRRRGHHRDREHSQRGHRPRPGRAPHLHIHQHECRHRRRWRIERR